MLKTHVAKSWAGDLKGSTIGLAMLVGLGSPLLVLLADRSVTTRDLVSTSTVDATGESAARQLPPVDELTMDSDFRAFFHPKVDEDLKRAALKKLFSDPRFNVMDGLDTYIDDYSKPDPLPVEMLAQMRSAQKIFKWARNELEAGETAPVPTPTPVPVAVVDVIDAAAP